jgi:hypothetical protein
VITRPKSSSPKKARKSPEPESTVKLYTPESTPQSQEQN